ncbi:Toll/interleukin-1 receptor domain-containing protein [Tanacetum coccineum]
MKVLELSYNGLDEDYKEIFLDVACIFKGQNKDDAIIALESCGFRARIGLKVLEQKSLITISEFDHLGMHDHIEEMGKNIVRRVNPNEPEKHSRLWIVEEIKEILANDSATQATKCITLDTRGLNSEIIMNGLSNMKELRFLQLRGSHVSRDEVICGWDSCRPILEKKKERGKVSNWIRNALQIFNVDKEYVSEDLPNVYRFGDWDLPNGLRFLRSYGCPFSSLPKTFQATNLVGLEMEGGHMVKLWKDGEEKPFLKLRFLKFTFSQKLRTLDLSVAPNLDTLILKDCRSLDEVHFQVTPNLKELRIHNCWRLGILHMPAESPKLTSLDLVNLKLRTLDLSLAPNLETLRVKNCHDLVELHMPAECPKLVNLYLSNCLKLRTFHLRITPNLETPRLNDCTDIVELRMPAKCPKLVNIDLSNLKLTSLHLGITLNLKTLRLNDCHDMVELRIPAECPKLVNLGLFYLKKLRTFHLGITPNLETLRVKNCHDLVELRMPAECPKLVNLDLFYLKKLRAFHLGITPNLEMLRVKNCHDLVELRMPAECPKLVNLDLNYLKLTTLHLGITPNLTTLRLNKCHHMVELRMPAECPNLETVSVKECPCLVELQIPAECPKLVNLNLSYLIQLAEFPEEFGRLECLKELDITGTGISRLPESIFRVKGLHIFGSRQHLESCGFTSMTIS